MQLWRWGMLAFGLAFGLTACASGDGGRTSKARYVMTNPMEAMVACREDAPARQWAVVIGVNDYQDGGIADLDGAVNDAWSFYHFLASPAGGSVPRERMRLLLNQEATREAVVGSLGKFLANACPKDQVMIYFAGHGMPEPERPEEAFLLVHDTKLENLVGSAISMNQLPEFLSWRANKAGSLMMIVDACHSGTIKFPGKRGVKNLTDSKERLQTVDKGIEEALKKHEDKGWGAISAAASDQFAAEIKGGCMFGDYAYLGGLFTCHLLKGLSGDADKDANGQVNVDELYAYLDSSVRRDSRGQQSPKRSGSLKGDMTVSYTSTSGRVAIPTLPEKYTGAMEHPLRPWVYTGAGLTVAAAATGAYFGLKSQDSADQADNTIGDERADLLDQSDRESRIAVTSYGLAAGLGALTLSGFLIDFLQEPEDIEDVYEKAPLFELGVVPGADARPDGYVRMNLAW